MNRLSRVVVLISLLSAAAFEIHLAAADFGSLAYLPWIALAGGFGLGLAAANAAAAAALAFTYVAPLALNLAIGRYRPTFLLIWMALMAGVLAGSGPLRTWSFPARWRWALVTWALVLAVTWPIVMWRETNFDFSMLGNMRMPTTSGGVAPGLAGLGILDGVVTQLLGLLWFDWLCARFRGQPLERWHRFVTTPMAASAALACLLGAYQGFVDITWWNSSRWPALRRAAGGLLDANAFGMAAACWVPAFVAYAYGWPPGRRMSIAIAGPVLALMAVWASGSRTALLAALVGLATVAATAVWRLDARRKKFVVLAVVPAAAAIVVALTVMPLQTIGPLERLRDGIRRSSAGGLHGVAVSLWNRDAYGAASTLAIREAPWFGVGAGAFTLLSADYAFVATGFAVPFDNAQNWFRHQLVELGIVGSVGCIAWALLFAAVLLRTRAPEPVRVPAAAVKGALLGLTAGSMLGVPSVSTAVTLTFWTLAFWYLVLAAPAVIEADDLPQPLRRRSAEWALIGALVLAAGAGTAYASQHALSVPERARRFGWNYQHGFYDVDTGTGASFLYTARRSTAVVEVTGRVLALTVWTDDPSTVGNPVKAKVWVDDRLVLDAGLQRGSPVALRIRLPADNGRLIVRTSVDRTWKADVPGPANGRDVGLALNRWTFEN